MPNSLVSEKFCDIPEFPLTQLSQNGGNLVAA